jgi:NAD(P)-dependent dehydrogenase (short-subunit alcohol dehydrogenase family)
MRANLDTAFVAARACLPDLIASRGAMVLLASIASLAAGPEVWLYHRQACADWPDLLAGA